MPRKNCLYLCVQGQRQLPQLPFYLADIMKKEKKEKRLNEFLGKRLYNHLFMHETLCLFLYYAVNVRIFEAKACLKKSLLLNNRR